MLKFEKATGLGLGKNGKNHQEKAEGRATQLKRIMAKENLSQSDMKLALYLYKKLIKSLGEK